MSTTLFLSPHLDDVAFSCGATVAKLARDGRAVVATMFTASVAAPRGFALACQTDKGLSADVDYMAVRRAEDAEAAAALGAEAWWLDFPEAPHRGYGSAAELFAGVKLNDDIHESLTDRLEEFWEEVRPDWVFAPLGLGDHADHLQLIHSVCEFVSGDDTIWYRDAPYAIRNPAAEPSAPVAGRSGFALPIGAHLAAKLDACAAYRTQLAFQFGGEAAMREKLTAFAIDEGRAAGLEGPTERFSGRGVAARHGFQ